jgi:hypothetical protein
MNIFQRLYKSVYDIKWLSERRKDGKSGAGHFFLLTFLVSLIFGVWLSVTLIGFWNDAKTGFGEQVPYFKAEMKAGSLSVTELPQPFFKEGEEFKVMVDTATSSQVKIGDFVGEGEKAVILVTAKEVSVFNPSGNKIETRLFKDAPDFSTDKNEILAGAQSLQWLMFFLVLLILILSYSGLAIANAFFLFFWSLVVWTVSAIGKKDWKYMEVVSVGAFAMTAPLLVDAILFASGFKPPFLSAFIFLIYMLSIVFALSNTHIKKGEDKK